MVLVHVVSYQMTPVLFPSDRLVYLHNTVKIFYCLHMCFLRCPVGKYWHYHGPRCSEAVSLPLDPSLIVTCLVGSLCFVCAVIGTLVFINRKCIKNKKAVTLV